MNGKNGSSAEGLAEIVRASGGNLCEAARRLEITRDTVVSRLRRHGLMHTARAAREERQSAEVAALRKLLDELSPSDRVRVLLARQPSRASVLRELAERDDLDDDARDLLRRARVTGGQL
jgi:hypothetical protein